jgi:hypothetical protein
MDNQNNKNLLNEVNRMKKIMGILNEAPIPVAPKNLRPVLEYMLERLGFSKAEIKVEAASEGLLTKFEKNIRNSDIGQQSLMVKLDNIAEKFANPATINEGKQALKAFIKEPGVYQTFVEHLKTSDPLKFQIKANQVVDKILSRLPQDSEGKSLGDALKKKYKGNAKGLYDALKKSGAVTDRLKIWVENYAPQIVGDIKDVGFIETFLKGITSDKAATWITIFRNTFKSAKKLQNDFIELSKGAEEKIKKGEDASEEFKKMGDILLSTKKWFNQLPKNLYEGIDGNPGWKDYINPTIREKIESDANGFKKLYDESLKKHGFLEPIGVEFKAYAEAWPFRLPYKRNTTQGKFFFKKWDKNFLSRWANLLLIRDPRKFDEMYSALMARGSKGSILANTVGRLTIDAVVAPAFVATIYEILKWSSATVEASYNAFAKLFDWKQVNWIDYDAEKDENYFHKVVRIWIEDYVSLLPHNLKEFFDPMKQTYIDEFVNALEVAAGLSDVINKVDPKKLEAKLKNNVKQYINEHPDLKNCGLLETDTMVQILEKVKNCKGIKTTTTPTDSTKTSTVEPLPDAPTNPSQTSEDITSAEVDSFIDSQFADLKSLIVKPYTVNSDKTVTLYISGQTNPIATLFKIGGKLTLKNN